MVSECGVQWPCDSFAPKPKCALLTKWMYTDLSKWSDSFFAKNACISLDTMCTESSPSGSWLACARFEGLQIITGALFLIENYNNRVDATSFSSLVHPWASRECQKQLPAASSVLHHCHCYWTSWLAVDPVPTPPVLNRWRPLPSLDFCKRIHSPLTVHVKNKFTSLVPARERPPRCDRHSSL